MGSRAAWYRLYVRERGRWRLVCEFQADSHGDAFDEAELNLRPEHQGVAIRLEQVLRGRGVRRTRGK